MMEIRIGNRTAARLDRARKWLDCSANAEYSQIIEAALDEAEIEIDMTEDYE